MTDNLLASLMSRDFVLVASDSTVGEAAEAVPLGYAAVVMQGALPVGLLTEDRLLELEEAQQPLAHYAGRYLTATLIQPETSLPDILLGMNYSPSVRWHVVVDAGEVLGVIAPAALFALLSDWLQRPPGWLPEGLQTLLAQMSTISLGSLLRLPGNPIQPPPRICGLCPGATPPHRPAAHELDYTNRLAPTCKLHPGTPIVWLNPCA